MTSAQEDKIREFLEKNNFYAYLKQSDIIDKFKANFDAVESNNQRIIQLPKTWSEVDSFGQPRKLLVLELGGEYLKLFNAEVLSKNKVTILQDQKFHFEKSKSYTPETLFYDIKKQLDSFIPDNQKSEIQDTILVFAYALDQFVREDGYYDGTGKDLEKMHQYKGFETEPVGSQLEVYLQKSGYPNIKISAINDALASLLTSKAIEIINESSFDFAINITIGGGANISYTNCHPGISGCQLINSEFGNFLGAEPSNFDLAIQQKLDQKDYQNEKMISATWQHMVLKEIVHQLISQHVIEDSFLSKIDLDPMDSTDLEKMTHNSLLDINLRLIIKFIWKEIIKRGASLCGLGVAALIQHLVEKEQEKQENYQICLIETGGVLDNSEGFREYMIKVLNNQLINMELRENVDLHIFNPKHDGVFGAIILDSQLHKQAELAPLA